MKDLLRNLVHAADGKDCRIMSSSWRDVADNSFENYHAFGVSYLCLHRSAALTVKVYFFSPDTERNSYGWLVWPHNHRYEFESFTLLGEVKNLWFEVSEVEKRQPFWLHSYLAEDRKATPVLPIGLKTIANDTIGEGESFKMGIGDIHTLALPAGHKETIVAQLQYHDRTDRTVMISPEKAPQCGERLELYAKMPPARCYDRAQRLLEVI